MQKTEEELELERQKGQDIIQDVILSEGGKLSIILSEEGELIFRAVTKAHGGDESWFEKFIHESFEKEYMHLSHAEIVLAVRKEQLKELVAVRDKAEEGMQIAHDAIIKIQAEIQNDKRKNKIS